MLQVVSRKEKIVGKEKKILKILLKKQNGNIPKVPLEKRNQGKNN